jgi:hypothetical protein
MAQNYDDTLPESGVTKFSELYAIIRNHAEVLRSSFSGTSFPTDPAPIAGQPCWRTDLGLWYVYTGTEWIENLIANSGIGLEITNARGTKPTLDERLDVSMNEDGTLKASPSLNPSQWHNPSLTQTYVSSTSFTAVGCHTDIYLRDRRLKCVIAAGNVYSEVVSSSYSSGTGLTTVVIKDAVLTSPLTRIEHSIFSPRYSNFADGAMSYRMTGIQQLVVEAKTDNYTVTLNDFGKTFVMNTTTSKTFSLPSVASGEIGSWVEFVKIPSGEIHIDAADSDTIEDSSAGGEIYCSGELGPASLKLKLVTATWWKIESGVGPWQTT